jgi:hypothetical protein
VFDRSRQATGQTAWAFGSVNIGDGVPGSAPVLVCAHCAMPRAARLKRVEGPGKLGMWVAATVAAHPGRSSRPASLTGSRVAELGLEQIMALAITYWRTAR